VLKKIKNLIIGAGPAGLAAAGRLRNAGIDFEVVEASDKIAVRWHHHYDRLHLHTVKQFSHLPHLQFPENYPLYVPRKELVDYFENYAKQFEIKPHFNTEVQKISKAENGNWKVLTQGENEYEAKNVILATGVNRIPHEPKFEGQQNFSGNIIHSRAYKNAKPYKGKKVLVIGMGNTGAELALDLSEHQVETAICVRNPISVVPRDLNGRSVQVTSKQLAKLPFGLGDWLGTQIRKVYFGDLTKYGLESSKVHPAVQLRETGKTPIVDIGTIKAIKEGKIKVVPGIKSFDEIGVSFVDGSSHLFDEVIMATGYRPHIENLVERGEELLDKYNCPKSAIGNDYHEGLYFIGFDNYKLGGILGTIFTDSEIILDHIKSN